MHCSDVVQDNVSDLLQQPGVMWQVKYREMCAHNAEELRLLHQDLGTAGDMLRSHKASITSVVESTVAHVTAVHAELMAA